MLASIFFRIVRSSLRAESVSKNVSSLVLETGAAFTICSARLTGRSFGMLSAGRVKTARGRLLQRGQPFAVAGVRVVRVRRFAVVTVERIA